MIAQKSMTWRAYCVALCAIFLAGSAAKAQNQPPLVLTVEAAVMHALHDHPSIEAARFDALAAKAEANIKRSLHLPKLSIADMQVWAHSSFHLSRNFIPGLTPISSRGMPQDFTANIASVSVHQPITGIFAHALMHASSKRAYRARRADVRTAAAQLRATIESDFLSLFEARALGDTVRASERSLLEQVSEARHEVEAGTLTATDVLRIEAAAAGARQQVIAADADATEAEARLMEDLGLAGNSILPSFVEPSVLLAPPKLLDVQTERLRALKERPELVSEHHTAHAKRQEAQARGFLVWVPNVALEGSYYHVWAEPIRQAYTPGSLGLDAFSVMLNASWTVWAWGQDYYTWQQSKAEARAAEMRRRALERQVGIEVAERHASYIAAASAIEVAQSRLESAKEAFRVMQVQVRAGAATTTDLLDSEAARTSASVSLVRARYAAGKAHVALRRAVGVESETIPLKQSL